MRPGPAHLAAFWVLAATAAGQDATPAPRPDRPNVLLLLADDQRRDTIGAWTDGAVPTPNLDRLVRKGFSFRNAYCFGSIHGAVCQPSRAMMLTGRSLWRVPMDLAGVETLPETLEAAGWTTYVTGKWHNGAASLVRAFGRGTALMLGGMSNHEAVPVHDLTADGLGPARTGETFSSRLFADAAIEFLEEHEGPSPFFLWVAFTAPHDPRQPPDPWLSRARERDPPLPPNFLPQHPFDNGALLVRDEHLAPWPRPPELIRDQIEEYHGMVMHLDAQVGRVLEALERCGHAEDTVVVYAADHGLSLGSHGLLGKQSVYEEAMGAPLVVAGPGVPHGSSEALVYLHDLHPTLCRLLGVAPPAGVDGEDLGPLLAGDAEEVRDSLFLAYTHAQRAVRRGSWKLIRYPRIDRVQLFDLAHDPYERYDLAAEPEQTQRIEDLTATMRAWQRRTSDPHPLVVDDPADGDVDLSGHARRPDRWQPDWILEKYFDR